MDKKLFLKFSILLFVLSMSTNITWAAGALSSTPMYSATLTANVSSTGGGKVYVTEDDVPPSEELYADSDSKTKGLVLSMQGMDNLRVSFWAWQLADDGYYFAGWSYADNGFDLGKGGEEYNNYSALYDVSMEKADYEVDESGDPIPETLVLKPEQYTIYATFEPVRIAGYAVSGSNTITEGNSCTQTVTFELSGEDIDADDFYAPAITSSTGGGSWTNASGDEFTISDLNIEGTTATVVVKFTAPNTEVAEYSATLQLKTKADITMNVLLGARIVADGVEAIRYNSSKVQYEGENGSGSLNSMLGKAVAGDIIKLNGDYNEAVSINKTITFDLNGYELSNTLTVAGGNVTIAYSPYGGSANALSVTGGKAIVNGGAFGSLTVGASGTVEQNGATITGAATSNGSLTTYDGVFKGGLTSAGTLTVNGGTFEGEIAINVTGGTAQIKKGTIAGTTYGVQSAGTTTIEKLAVLSGETKALNGVSGTLTVNGGKFTDPDNLKAGSVIFNAGYFQTNDSEATEVLGKHVWRNTSGAEFREGYEFFVGSADAAKAAGVSVCHIGGTSYAALEDALAYANNTSDKVIIIMDNDYTMPAGYYTLPANAVLIIPKNNDQGNETKTVDRVIFYQHAYETPSKFRCLTLSKGVNLDVHGTIEVSGTQYSSYEAFASSVYGPYGQLQLNQGSTITLQDGSELRAWGYVTGDIDNQDAQHNVPMGEIDARRGSTVREQFQMGDWKGARFSGLGVLDEENTVFPLNTYFIQNIEVPVKYHPGASLSTAAGVTAAEDEWGSMGTTVSDLLGSANISMSANDIRIIGVTSDKEAKSMFMMDAAADAENTWVRKWYDASKDQQVYEINSGAHIGCLIIPLVSSPLFPRYLDDRFPEDLTMNSGQYYLPITNNFKLHLLSGTMDFTQSTELLPGSEVEVDKEGTALLSEDDPDDDIQGGYLFVYDKAEWGNYAGGVPARRVKYSPVFEGEPTTRGITLDDLQSASINVHGTFDTYGGQVYVSESGANIFSSVEDAGTFLFSDDATDAVMVVNQVTTSTGGGQVSNNFVSVKLKNADGGYTASYVDEGHHAQADDAYCYLDIDGTGARWTSFENTKCFMHDNANDIYYAKPQEYVALTSDEENPITHTYGDLAGAGRLFILVTDIEGNNCQWWEVEAKDNYFHCIHPDNDTYYEWDGENEIWKEKTFTITWRNWNGDIIQTTDENGDPVDNYVVTYGTKAEFLGENPTRAKDDDYTYDFTGWSPALGKVTSNVTYTATYEAKQIKYTITFMNDGGMEIERHLLARNEMPVCENVPTRPGFTLEWSPAIAAVTDNATYTATWLPVPPTEYEIKFMDYDGTTELKKCSVEVGTVPTPPADPTGKPETDEYTYVFDHWSPALEEVSATSAKVYTAVYREEARTYTIYYYIEDGETLNTTQELSYGATPTPPAVSKEDPENGHTYSLVWKTLDESGTIQTVTGAASYKPTYIDAVNKYTVSVRSNPAGACEVYGSGIYEYNESNDAVKIGFNYDNSTYNFIGWSDGIPNEEDYWRTIAVTSDITLIANFEYKGEEATVSITWKNGDEVLASNNQMENTATLYTGITPTKSASAESTYVFDGWSLSKDGDLAYKNGQTPWATEDATYYAHFAATPATYTIAWKNEAGTADIEVDYNQPYGAAIAYNSATPTKQATAAATYTFDGWSTTPNSEGDIVTPATVSGDATYYAHFAATPKTYTITFIRDDGSLIDKAEVAYGIAPTHADPTKPSTPAESYEFDHWDRAFEQVVGLTSYTAYFNATPNMRTITWVDGDGNTLKTDENAEYGATPFYDGETPTKAATSEYTYTFEGWSPMVVPVTGDATYTATFSSTPIVSNLVIGINDSEDLNDEVTERTNLIITSNGVASGQLLGAGNLSITGEAIFRLVKTFNAGEWYAVAVPWTVNPSNGIYAGSTPLSLGSQIYVIEFDAEAYVGGSTNTYDYWTFLHQTDADMVPGKLYMIYLASGQSQLDFHKKAGADILTTETSVAITGGDDSRANWNAIANPALYHANLSTGATNVQKYNGNNSYIVGSTSAMIVGEPMFVQVTSASTVEATPVGGASPAPYRRAPKTEDDTKFVVELTQNGQLADRMIVQTAEEKENCYVIGQDLAKFGVSTKVAQMWINRYDAKLCVNTVAPVNGTAEYPLGIFAPAAGEYTIHHTPYTSDSDYTLYLTYNGEAIWNLSDGAYVLNLNKGTDANYGLRVSARAPQVVTGVDEAIVDAQGDTQKVLINNQVFIIRGEKVYTVTGAKVERVNE